MSTQFDPRHHLVGIEVRLFGPSGDIKVRLALDAGARPYDGPRRLSPPAECSRADPERALPGPHSARRADSAYLPGAYGLSRPREAPADGVTSWTCGRELQSCRRAVPPLAPSD